MVTDDTGQFRAAAMDRAARCQGLFALGNAGGRDFRALEFSRIQPLDSPSEAPRLASWNLTKGNRISAETAGINRRGIPDGSWSIAPVHPPRPLDPAFPPDGSFAVNRKGSGLLNSGSTGDFQG